VPDGANIRGRDLDNIAALLHCLAASTVPFLILPHGLKQGVLLGFAHIHRDMTIAPVVRIGDRLNEIPIFTDASGLNRCLISSTNPIPKVMT